VLGRCLSAGGVDKADDGESDVCIAKPNPDGFLGIGMGMEGGSGGEVDRSRIEGRVGDGGRLTNELVVGVFGVLEGRGPGSTGRTGKLLNKTASRRLSRDLSLGEVVGCTLLFVLALGPVGTDGIICHPFTSSSSSIEGKCCENSVK
jgi:hypothetical protein